MNQRRRVFITGASRGIGKSLAMEFAKNGWELYLCATNLELLKEVSLQIQSIGAVVHISNCDVAIKSDMVSVANKAWEQLNGIDLAILNAGISIHDTIPLIKSDDLERIYSINVFGLLYGIEVFEVLMRSSGGAIAGVTSLADARGFKGNSGYCSSKSAASFILEGARMSLRNTRVKIITVKPGFVATDMTSKNNFFMPFLTSPDRFAEKIYPMLESGKERIYYPWQTAFLSYLLKIMPSPLFESMMNIWKRPN